MPATAAIVGTAATVGLGAAGAAGAFNPSQPNFSGIDAANQSALIDLLPKQYSASATYDPQFAALQGNINYQNIFGSPGTQQTISTPTQGFRNSITGEFRAGTTPPQWEPTSGGLFGMLQPNPWQPFTQNVPSTVTVGQSPGLLNTLEGAQPRLTALQNQANTATRTATLGDVAALGPGIYSTTRAFNPQATALLDSLDKSAQEGLDAGYSILPSQMRAIQQNIRAAQAARGQGFGPSDALAESQAITMAGEGLRQQRLQNASTVTGMQQGYYGDPFARVLGISAGTGGLGSVSTGTGNPTGAFLNSMGTVPLQLGNNANIAGYNAQQRFGGTLAGQNYQSLFGGLSSLFTGNNTPASQDPNAVLGY